ncbi:MAG: glutamate--tRNA ligase family protein [Nitrosopumilus sp.]|nr:glutamate--tRNA ligase family protein [Nitrosopumilus sp.]MDA7943843.1 glutamate--tRNA ligase family protein [Nitrosopumilus sp.]MDA7953236.1 glutamate--tRNA ligase family protein [Nitrosopumilus sp.]MDA7957993.1 glutamate--tRNA ligase family protein [Nitrosopumilus sp.]MDA7999047.1 glutamate--tRNA ligase family protein [Nitrosopumilus sp.]
MIEGLREMAVSNAASHGGRAQEGAVLGMLLAARPDLRADVPAASAEVARAVSEVNSMDPRDLQREAAALPAREPRREREGLPEIPGAAMGAVVTRFPPEPNGYPHIGHAKAAIINAEYARMYGGRFILRFDDTNPESERMEYHAAINVGLEWLGVRPDETKCTSDDMEEIHAAGGRLVGAGAAYVCTCSRDAMGRNRRDRAACRCSYDGPDEAQKKWRAMFTKSRPGSAVLRFRGDMKSDNTVMRDPVLFRIVDVPHYRQGTRYRVWPSYDMAVAIEDSRDGVTHSFRSKEFEMRAELAAAINGALGMRTPERGFFSRLELRGMPTSKRATRPLIEEGKVSWYDDPRLPTLEGLKRRGIKPEAVRRFVMSLGMTKSESTAPFESLVSFNRSVIDPVAGRLHMVEDPVRLDVAGLPPSVEIRNHPSSEMGSRTVDTSGGISIAEADAGALGEGSEATLMGIGRVRITRAGGSPAAEYLGGAGGQAIQWVPAGSHRLRILVPGELFRDGEYDEGSLSELDVYSEPAYLGVEEGAPVQFVRFGYCRKDSQTQAIFTHK